MILELNVFTLVFIAVFIQIVIINPLKGLGSIKNLKENKNTSETSKIGLYKSIIIWELAPVILVLFTMPFSDFNFQNIGIRMIKFDQYSFGNWISYSVAAVYFLSFIYNIYSIFKLKGDENLQKQNAAKLPEELKLFLPVTVKEKKVWTYVAITAGTTEEILYRGYLFFALGIIFPALSIFMVFIVSSIIFGIGHLYQGAEAVKPAIIGIFYGLFYLVFGSIFPVIILHFLQDYTAKFIFNEEILYSGE